MNSIDFNFNPFEAVYEFLIENHYWFVPLLFAITSIISKDFKIKIMGLITNLLIVVSWILYAHLGNHTEFGDLGAALVEYGVLLLFIIQFIIIAIQFTIRKRKHDEWEQQIKDQSPFTIIKTNQSKSESDSNDDNQK